MKKQKTLNSVFTNFINQGIFTYLNQLDVPWDKTISTQLNLAYHGNKSGMKLISPLVNNLLNPDDILTDIERLQIANILFTMYKDNWTKKYAILSLQYDPITNYDRHEKITDKTTHSGIDKVENTPNLTTTTINTGTDITDIGSDNTTNTNKISAFNNGLVDNNTSNTVSQAKQDKVTYDTTNIVTNDGKDTTNTEHGLVIDYTHTNETKGNIGVTTSQQMIQSEIDLWKWNFFQSIFDDIDTILTLKIY